MATAAQWKRRSKNPEANCALGEGESTSSCSPCKVVRYCSDTCQTFDWRMHHEQECCPPNADDLSSSTLEEAHKSDLANMSKSQESGNHDVSTAFKSKVENLYELFDEMESSLGTRGSEKEDVRTSCSHPLMTDWPSKEIAILHAKLDYVMAERDTLRSEVKLLKSEIDMLRGFQRWAVEEEVSDLEMNNSYKSSPALLTYLEQKLEFVLGSPL